MANTLDKTIKLVTQELSGQLNISHMIDDDLQKEIVDNAINGKKIDEETMHEWIQKNKEAVSLIRQYDDEDIDDEEYGEKESPFKGACKAIYPLIGPAVIHLASRLISHLVRNNKVVEVATAGNDPDGLIETRAKRVSQHMSWELLVQNESWRIESHKLMSIVASWGTGFREVYRDFVNDRNQADIIPPEDVIINNNVSSLEKAPRITIKKYFNKNDIYSFVNAGLFDDVDIDDLILSYSEKKESDPNDKFPVVEILKQYCLIDLDNDGYCEPYIVWIHEDTEKLLGIKPYYDEDDLIIKDNKLIRIDVKPFVIDYHCIDDPNGRFFSIGLNYLLYNPNKVLNTLVRQLIDSGTLANQQGGFVTRAFKINNRDLNFELGEYKVVDVPPTVDLGKQIYPLPFKEPSNVLMSMLQLMIGAGKELGFITDVLTGDMEVQNVPATSMLAVVEASTRAIKPLIDKLYCSLSKEFRVWYKLNYKYLSDEEYQEYHNDENVYVRTPNGLSQMNQLPEMGNGQMPNMGQNPQQQLATLSKPIIGDYEFSDLDIRPVADPAHSSEAHKYAKLRAIMETVQLAPQSINVVEVLKDYYMELGIERPERYINPQQPQQQMDPGVIKEAADLMMKQQKQQHDMKMDEIDTQIKQRELQIKELQEQIKRAEYNLKKDESDEKQRKMEADAKKDFAEAAIKRRNVDIAEYDAETKRMQVEALEDKYEAEKTKAKNEKD